MGWRRWWQAVEAPRPSGPGCCKSMHYGEEQSAEGFPHSAGRSGRPASSAKAARPQSLEELKCHPHESSGCSRQESEQGSELTNTEEGRNRLMQPRPVTKEGPVPPAWPSELRAQPGVKRGRREPPAVGVGGKEGTLGNSRRAAPSVRVPQVQAPGRTSLQENNRVVRVLSVINDRNPIRPASRQKGIMS